MTSPDALETKMSEQHMDAEAMRLLADALVEYRGAHHATCHAWLAPLVVGRRRRPLPVGCTCGFAALTLAASDPVVRKRAERQIAATHQYQNATA